LRLATVAMSILVGAVGAFADGNRWYVHPSVITLTSSGFRLTATVPSGWSTEDGQVLPAMSLRSVCRVHGEFYRGRDWNRTLAAALDFGNIVRTSTEHRTLFRIGGHKALANQYTDGSGKAIENVYIDLADLETDSVAVWSFEGDNTAEGRQCGLQFETFIGSASIKLESDAGRQGTTHQ
jgi:hypothetical protein